MVATPERRVSRAPLRVLLVEDSEDDALLLLRALGRHGYETTCQRVQTPEAMREALASSSWDVIFSDYRMPRFSAAEALSLAQEAGSEAPFIVVSGRIGEDVAVEAMRAGAYDYVMKDNLARLWATVERGLEETKVRRELRRREDILDAVRFAADQFLGEALSWEESVRTVLRRLGEAAEASRVYVFENYVGEDGGLWNVQRYKWMASGVPPDLLDASDNSPVTDFPYRAGNKGRREDFSRWEEVLGRGEPIYGRTREFPACERSLLVDDLGILSMVLMPIFVEGGWWGFIGFDDCFEEREWSSAEVGALGAAAGTLGAAIRRRRTEDRLRQSEERYRAVIEQATDGIYLLDVESRRLLESNPSFQNMFGYTAQEVRGMEIYDVVAHPREDVDSTIGRTLQERRRLVGERQYRRKDGTLLDVEVGVNVISLDGRDVICTIVRDVTGRKRAEKALARSESRLRTIVETEPECVKVLGMDGSLLEMNPAGLSMIEADSLEQVRGRPVYEYVAPEHRADFVSLTKRVLRGGSGTLEFELVGLKGTRRWLDTHAVPLRDARGEIAGLLAITRDITARKKNEEALRESEERFRSAFESAAIGMGLVGPDGRWLRVNQPLCDIVGYPEQELLGLTFQDITHPDDLDADLRQVERMLRGEIRAFQMEKRYLHKDGHAVWILLSASLVRDNEGNPLYFISQIQDITRRKWFEEELRESERLYRAVIEQATENIFLIDVGSMRIVEANRAFREALDYTEEELRGMTLYDIVAADRESVDENVRLVLEQNIPSVGERMYRRKDGSTINVEVSASIVFRDGKETLCAVAHDVTERARAQRLLEERVSTLSGIAESLTLDLPVGNTLDVLAKSVVGASTAVACGIVLVGEGPDSVSLFGSHGLPEGYTAGLQEAYRTGARSPSLEAFHTRQPMLVRDLRRFLLADSRYAPIHRFVREAPWDVVYSLPLVARSRALGAIFFCFLPGQDPNEEEKVFLRAVADQAAVAVENVRLFVEARGKAALEERQKLARELHDSVSQALYGIALGVETARELLEGDPGGAAEPLDYTAALAEAGMTEMRALIFELRPESLEKEGLVAALEKQAAAIAARHRIRVDAALGGEPEAPLETKEALYRIAQEALHNTVKHARAGRVHLKLERGAGRIELEVSDDGSGFDPGGSFPGHLGLKSMRERAGRLGGTLEVESRPGQGTRILARIPSR